MIDQIGMYAEVLNFMQGPVAASQTAVEMFVVDVKVADGASLIKRLTMPVRGSIVGIVVDASAAATAGTCSVAATIGGTASSVAVATLNLLTQKVVMLPRGKVPYAALAKLGVKITTDGDWDGTANDIVVRLICLNEGYMV
jgi:hypothetical protein